MLASLFVGHTAQKSKLHNLQYDEGGNHMAETETENNIQNRQQLYTVNAKRHLMKSDGQQFHQYQSTKLTITSHHH
jgi:hypothetical protein